MGSVATPFVATRDELLGDAALLGTAELARHVCVGAERALSLLAVTSRQMRRVDAWTDSNSVVTHPLGSTPSDRQAGSLCARVAARDLAAALLRSLVGDVPVEPSPTALELGLLGALSPATLPPTVSWVIVIAAHPVVHGSSLTVLASADGLCTAEAPDLRSEVTVVPVSGATAAETFAHVFVPPRTMEDLLSD